MKNLKVRPFAFFFFGIFALCFIGLALATGASVKDVGSALKLAYKTVPIIILIWAGFVGFAWKWRVFKGWLVPFPNLDGTWQGTIQTTWKDADGKTPGPIPVILTVKQSFGRVSCVMRTAEMSSWSYLADFWLDTDEQIRKLGYSYTSSPGLRVQDRSAAHDGTMVLEIIGDPVTKLKGIYWTTRKSTGDVVLTKRCEERLDDFPDDLGEHPMTGK
jgi:hypothetical protein